MLCYRDMQFCSDEHPQCGREICDRRLTPAVLDAARRWWGKDGAPIAVRPCPEPEVGADE